MKYREIIASVFRVLGTAWAACVTLPFFIALLPCWSEGWYTYAGKFGNGWVWVLDKSAPAWMQARWEGWAGVTLGIVVILKSHPNASDSAMRTLNHELVHVHQYMLLGPFFLVLYGLFYLVIRLFLKQCHPRYDSPLEIAARRGAGQYVDIWGAVLKIRQKKYTDS